MSLHLSLHRFFALAAGPAAAIVPRQTRNIKLHFKRIPLRFITLLLSADHTLRSKWSLSLFWEEPKGTALEYYRLGGRQSVSRHGCRSEFAERLLSVPRAVATG